MFTEFDVLVCVIVLGSMLLSMATGFVRDSLNLFGWVGAAVFTLIFYPWAAKHTEELFKSGPLVNGVAVIATYLFAYAIISLIGRAVMGSFKEKKGNAFDRSFGGLLGLIKGFVIVSVLHFAIVQVAGTTPLWLEEGETFHITEKGSGYVEATVADFIKEDELAVPGASDVAVSKERIENFMQKSADAVVGPEYEMDYTTDVIENYEETY